MLVTTVLQEVANSLTIELNIYSVQLINGKYECRTTNTQYLNDLTKVDLNGVTYTVESFVLNESITLSGSSTPSTGVYTLPNPFFIHGKLKQTSAEVQKKNPELLIWMFELSPRTRPEEVTTNLDTTGSVRLFFMNASSYKNFTSEDHRIQVIEPLESLVGLFIKALKKHKRTGKIFLNTQIAHAKFTNDTGETDSEGNNILPLELSGIEVSITVPIKRDLTCKVRNIPEPVGGAFNEGFNEGFKIT